MKKGRTHSTRFAIKNPKKMTVLLHYLLNQAPDYRIGTAPPNKQQMDKERLNENTKAK
jgi:hypothetical protein